MLGQYSKKQVEVDPTQACLERLLHGFDAEARRRHDPVDYAHRYELAQDREVVGLIASSLAFGNALAAMRSVERALDALGEHPSKTIVDESRRNLSERLAGFVHRIYRTEHLVSVLVHAGRLLERHGSLGHAFALTYEELRGDFRASLASFADDLRGERADRSLRHLVSDPRAGSACKRLLLFCRWMIRPADGVDLGLWSLAPSVLVMPVDTHVHRISRNLGLTTRRTASWATAEEITESLRRFDRHDPVKYDFAICHLGVSRHCPSRPDRQTCRECVLRSVCGVWGDGAFALSA